MKRPTQTEWNDLKEQRKRASQGSHQAASKLPDDLFLDPNNIAPEVAPEHAQGPSKKLAKSRKFRRFDETWAGPLLAADPPVNAAVWQLALVLLAQADFQRQIKITSTIAKEARLTHRTKRPAIEDLERLGLIQVEWRGRGRSPIATPLHLSGRPRRR
jgi:hypothetical protein